ncbi:MAG: NAD(P)-dependent oxidoreductase [Micropruina sp.]
MSFLPFALDLSGRRIVCIGGGRVGTRRAISFADAGAEVTVISPEITDQLAAEDRITVLLREFAAGDLAGADLAHTATGVDEVDAAVVQEATAQRVWCVDASNAGRATAHVLVRRVVGDLTVAVHANGDPRRSRAVADSLVATLTDSPHQA